MLLKFNADPIQSTIVLSKEVRAELRRHAAATDSDRVKLAGQIILAIRQWHKSHSGSFPHGSAENDSLTDQATYAIRVLKKELGVSVKYLKRQHAWVVTCGTESYTAFG